MPVFENSSDDEAARKLGYGGGIETCEEWERNSVRRIYGEI